MGKLVAIQTYDQFELMYNQSQISERSLNFILDTGQLYTHGLFFNISSFGTETNGYVPIKIAGTTKNVSLAGHTHSNYHAIGNDIDIGNNKIVSGQNDILKYIDNSIYLGNSSNPTYFYGTLKTIKSNTEYTILDTSNFLIESKTITGFILQNVATIKYGNTNYQIDYVKRLNVINTLDNLATHTNMGTTNENNIPYGFLTMYTDGELQNPKYAQLRVNINTGALEVRSSGSTTWKSASTDTWKPATTSQEGYVPELTIGGGTIATQSTEYVLTFVSGGNGTITPTWKLLPANAFANTWNLGSSSQDGYVPQATKNYFLHCNDSTGALEWVANPNTNTWRGIYVGGASKVGTGTNTLPINFVEGSNVTITYEAAGTGSDQSGNAEYFNIKIASTNTWNANAVGVAGYVAAPTKAANANMTWQTDAEGVPAWRDSNNHTHSYLPSAGGTLTGPLTINSSVYNNYNEGIRITRAGNSWAGITFGSTGTSGAPTNGWFAATNPSNQFIINPDNSGNTAGLCLNKNGDLYWRNNVVIHSGNISSYASSGGSSNTTSDFFQINSSGTPSLRFHVPNANWANICMKSNGEFYFYETFDNGNNNWAVINCGPVYIYGVTNNNMGTYTGNPKVVFAERVNGSTYQRVALAYTDFDSYRDGKGLKVLDFDGDDPNVWFEVGGNCYAYNFYVTSDITKKTNISTLSEHIRKFTLRSTGKEAYGVIAQEVPEMFREGKPGDLTVNYSSILSYYVGQLENKVKELEQKVFYLEQRLNS